MTRTDGEGRLGEHKTAVVAPRDLEYGVSRMFEVMGARPNLTLRVFRTHRDAVDWLLENHSP